MKSLVINNINVSTLENALKTAHARLSSIYADKYCVWEARPDSAYPATCKTQTTPVVWYDYKSDDALKGLGTKDQPYLINTVEELTNRTSEDMMKVRNLGRKSLEEVLAKLDELGLSLSKGEE
jgi:hypothetical protein